MINSYEKRLQACTTLDSRIQIFSEIIIENTLKYKGILYEKDKKINAQKDVDFQVNYKNKIFNIEVKTPAIERRLDKKTLFYSVDYLVKNFDYKKINTEIIPSIFQETSDKNKFHTYQILTREDYRIKDYINNVKAKIISNGNDINILFISLYDSQHLCEYFKLLYDDNSIINEELKNSIFESIHIIILGCFGEKLLNSNFNKDILLENSDCYFFENMYSNQYGKEELVDNHKLLLDVIPNNTYEFNYDYEKYRCDDVVENQRLFPIHTIEYLKGNKPECIKDEVSVFKGSDYNCNIKTLFLKKSNIRYLFIRSL
jgi:hypothetical protein